MIYYSSFQIGIIANAFVGIALTWKDVVFSCVFNYVNSGSDPGILETPSCPAFFPTALMQ